MKPKTDLVLSGEPSSSWGSSKCCVRNCESSSHDLLGRKIQTGLTFHCFPAWRTNEGDFVSELTRRRRAAWVAAVGRSDITFIRVLSFFRVCSRHFHSGKPAFEMLDLDPDWVPSLHLGHNKEKSRKKRSRDEDDCGLSLRRPAPPPWREVKTALQTLLQGKPNICQQNQGEPNSRPTETRTSFRDFFRNALESSLEASIQSRAQSKNRSSSTESKVELDFKLPPLIGGRLTRKESASCRNCSQLLRRIRDLEHQLFQLASKRYHEGLEASLTLTQLDQNQDQQSSKEEREACDRTGRLSPGDVRVDDDNVVLDSEMAPSNAALVPGCPRFRREWLDTFKFLRYSPSRNVMWCQVCRAYANRAHRNHRMVKGSDIFVKSSLRKHSKSIYHLESVKRNWASSGSGVLTGPSLDTSSDNLSWKRKTVKKS